MITDILSFAEKDDFTLDEVRTILKFSLITNADGTVKAKHLNIPLVNLWNAIPNKKYLLMLYIDKKRRRKKQ